MIETFDAHMDPESFRKHGYAVIDWIAEYQKSVAGRPVLSTLEPGDVRAELPPTPPARPEQFEALMADMDRVIMPGITHWQSPNFFAYFPANISGPSILAELLSAGLGVQGMLWATSPACTELETHVLDWLVDAMALPEAFSSSARGGGVIQDSASSATLCALIAARERSLVRLCPDSEVREATRGQLQARLRIYASDQTHSSLEKAAMVCGLGRGALRLIASDGSGRIVLDQLQSSLAADHAAGLEPCFVQANSGTTGINAFDAIRDIHNCVRTYTPWIHVDAAMSGTAAICPDYRHLFDGLELVDSYTFNPHKWMFTNFDCNCMFVRDREALRSALTINPEYLNNSASDAGRVIDYRDWQIPLGRRFRALKLWFVLRSFGTDGLASYVRRHVDLAQRLAGQIQAHVQLELSREPELNLVCFYDRRGDETSRALLERINASGRAFLSHTNFAGRYTLRVCVGQTNTQAEHVDNLWALIKDEVQRSNPRP